ncbi:MAG: hypothetical protein ACXWV4_02400 [Flavitalea sp.]
MRLLLYREKRKLPRHAVINPRRSIGKSFCRNISNCPANRTLSPTKIIIGPVIHNPQRHDSFGHIKPNKLPVNKYIKPRIIGKGFISGIKGIASPKIIARM